MSAENSAPVTTRTLAAMKTRGEKFAVLTAYDASFARLLDEAGVEVILVGDSLGTVIQGHDSTLPVTLGDVIYHTRAAAAGCRRALLVADLPFMTATSPEQALASAGRLMQEGGAHMVKLEGGAIQVETVRRLTDHGIPVCAHLGLLPQSVHKLGGYRVQGRGQDAAAAMLADARALEQAGADLLVLECVPRSVGRAMSEALRIPVIGIGAGADTDAQVLVLYDILGITPGRALKFARNFMEGAGSVQAAVEAFDINDLAALGQPFQGGQQARLLAPLHK